MWNSFLIPIFFISLASFSAATIAPTPPLPAQSTAASAPKTAAPAVSKAETAAKSSRAALSAKYLGSAGTPVTLPDAYYPSESVDTQKYTLNQKYQEFFIGYHKDQLVAAFKTSKKDFSFYLWPREVCSVVRVSGAVNDNGTSFRATGFSATFKAMEQVVESKTTTKYYPYTKVEFIAKSKTYELKHFGNDTEADNCRATHCPPGDGKDIIISSEDYILIATNSPFCSIRVNADSGPDDTKQFYVIDKLPKKNPIEHNGRTASTEKSLSVVALPGSPDGKFEENNKGACCFTASNLYNTDPTWTGVADEEHITTAVYAFKKVTAGKADKWARELRSFLLEISQPKKCPWIRLCFAKADMGGNNKQCNEANKNLEIFPKNGIMIRTDDDQAVMLGATSDELHTFRFEFTVQNNTKEPTQILAMRYGMASEVHTGINEFMKLEMVHGNDYEFVLQMGPGCVARLNNDWQQTSLLSGKSPNQLKLDKCSCHTQMQPMFKKTM